MNTNFKDLMYGKSDDQLKVYIDNPTKYDAEAINAAIAELSTRGHSLTDEERQKVDTTLSIKKAKETEELYPRKESNIVQDPDAPLLYSQCAIWAFSAIVNPLFGTILMAINIKKNSFKGYVPVLIIGIAYSIAALILVNLGERNTGLTLVVNSIGGIILSKLLWSKYIGSETKYRAKKIWIPLIIAVVIMIPLLLLAIWANSIPQ